ncbi:MAG: Holliday junction branch migration protein RuvA [Lactobacillaceae bacterium]|jgi:Holliday junction DNA helicase RuvA|nr:Holliday junction branch migration protein RuvA [Lactobacillaceae bacterium]
MYDFLSGTIESVYPDGIALNVQGVGFRLYNPTPYAWADETTVTKFFVHQVVRENEISLYGFKNQKNRDLFVKLLTVNGIGPKSAMAIIAYGDMEGLVSAIENEDFQYLTRYPGIGPKSAKMISLSLKGKMDDFLGTGTTTTSQEFSELSDALEAMVALGFARKDVEATKKYLEEFKGLTADEYIKKGLKLLVKNG